MTVLGTGVVGLASTSRRRMPARGGIPLWSHVPEAPAENAGAFSRAGGLGSVSPSEGSPIILHGLDRIDWSSLRHAYGAADDVPDLLRAVADGDAEALHDLDNNLFHQGGFVCSAATASLPFLLDLAGSSGTADRPGVLDLVGRLARQARDVHRRHVDPGWAAAWEAALPRLLELIDDPDTKVRRALMSALAQSPSGQDWLVGALRERWTRDGDAAVRLTAILEVGSLAPGCTVETLPETLAWLRDLRDHPDPQTRMAAVIALTRALPSYRAGADLRLLLQAMRDGGAGVWGEVLDVGGLPADWAGVFGGTDAQVIGWIGRRLEDQAPEAARFCLAFVGDRDDDRRIGAVKAAAKIVSAWRSPVELLLPALAERTADRAGAVRAYATHVIAALRDGAGDETGDEADLLAARLYDDRRLSRHGDGRIADIAAWGLALRGDARCLPRLVERLGGPKLGFGTATAYGRGMLYSTDLPGVEEVLAPLRGHAGPLLPAIRDRLRDEGSGDLRRALARALERWGDASAPAVPELVGLLGTEAHVEAVKALGAVGPAASDAVPSLEALLRRPPELPNAWAVQQSAYALPWAHWKITGDPDPLLAVAASAFGQGVTLRLWSYLADLGPLAAAYADRLRDLLDHREDWTRVEAARALYRITGDAEDAGGTLCTMVHRLASGKYLPVGWAALRYLRDMGAASRSCHPALRELLDSDRRHSVYGGWRAFGEDHELRDLAHTILSTAPESTG